MERETPDERLSRISTVWTLVFEAHAGRADGSAAAQNALMRRYGRAVHRYLLGALRDVDAAAELAQEFALRFLRGDFRRADPERGRFRDYVRVSLSRLVSEHHRARKRQPAPLPPDAAGPAAEDSDADADRAFLASWREELLERSWQALSEANRDYYAVLLHRIGDRDCPSARMAEQLSARLGKTVNSPWVRKTLQRARDKFADLLVEEVARSLETAEPGPLQEELKALDLLQYCGSALQRRG
jgi:RNA polymerase sigma-70 factor (ECF subfamily)